MKGEEKVKKKTQGLVAIVLALTMMLAACSSGGSDDEKSKSKGSDSGKSTGDSGKLEIFSWWTAGGEADGLDALLDVFKDKHSDIKVENAAVAGGAGSNAKQVLSTRMQGGDPPSTFQVHGGSELLQWVNSDKMQPLDDLYKKNGWDKKFPDKIIDMNSKDGHVYGVPVDIHRGNVLFFNKKIFDKYNVDPPKTFDDFFKVADKLKSEGVTPLALGDKEGWGATMIFENILLAKLGPDDYDKLWTGDVDFDDPKVKDAAKTFKKMLGYINKNHSSLAWQDATQSLIDGDAAMQVMGDFAEGYFLSKDWKPNKQFGWTQTPGTQGDFMVINDSFGLPKGVKNEDQVEKFLTVLGSKDGQDAFNPVKGSIPANLDADKSKYNEYSKSALKDFEKADDKDTLTLSLAHGSAAAPGFETKADTAVNQFVTQQNVDSFISSLKSASSQLKK